MQERAKNVEERLKLATTRASELETGLEESLKLQSHYAKLLNQYDGGERVGFDSVEVWIARLKQIGVIKHSPDELYDENQELIEET